MVEWTSQADVKETPVHCLQALFRAESLDGAGAESLPFVAAIVGPYDPTLPDEVLHLQGPMHGAPNPRLLAYSPVVSQLLQRNRCRGLQQSMITL